MQKAASRKRAEAAFALGKIWAMNIKKGKRRLLYFISECTFAK